MNWGFGQSTQHDTLASNQIKNSSKKWQHDKPHLEAIPCVGTLSTGGLPGGDVQDLCGDAHRALHLQLLVLGTTD